MAQPYWVVVPAAGAGRRMVGAAAPKQYLPLFGRTVIEHALAPFLADTDCAGIVVALAADDHQFTVLPVAGHPKVYRALGGAERRDSVLSGLHAVAERAAGDPWVLVHDAARPCLRALDIAALRAAAAANGDDGALLAVRVADTVKRADESGRVTATVPRAGLWRAQTPQAFRLQRLTAALEKMPTATDEASAVEALGGHPALVAGAPDNLKITEPGDLALAARWLAGDVSMAEQRVGFGIDVHAFTDGDHVWLGGVQIPHTRGVLAHSDGDVVLHALCDALLGAVGLGDIGQHFPDTDPRWKGEPSVTFLRHVLSLVKERGYTPVNTDITLLCEAPRLAPYRDAIRATLVRELGLAEDAVNLKATTTEKLGYLGRREGIAAEAVVLVSRQS